MANSSLPVTGGNVNTWTRSNGDHVEGVVLESSTTDDATVVNAENELFVRAGQRPSDLGVTATAGGTTGAVATLTLPAVAGKFHYITMLELSLLNAAARTGSATAVTVTSTNLPGSPQWIFGSAGAIGTVERVLMQLNSPMRSSAAGVATTIVGPSTANVLWRLNVRYYTSL